MAEDDIPFTVLCKMKQKHTLCDAVLVAQSGDEFRVHSAVMVMIPFFKQLFSQLGKVGKSARETCPKRLTIPDLTKEQIEAIIDYAYTMKTPVTKQNAESILQAATRLQIDDMVQSCCTFLSKCLDGNNCVNIWRFARMNKYHNLECASYRFILYNFESFAKRSKEFVRLTAEEVFSLLHDTQLNTRSEESVWEAVLRWVCFDKPTRRVYVPGLLSSVRSGLLRDDYFEQFVRRHPLVAANEQCDLLLMARTNFIQDMEFHNRDNPTTSNVKVTPLLAQPRMPHDILFSIGGWTGGQPCNTVETYDCRDNIWIQMDSISDPAGPRAYHKLAVLGNEIYVIGGFNGMTYFNNCRCFNVVKKEWRDVAPMHIRRCYVSVAVLNGIIYAMGGHDGHHRHNTAEKYDRKTNQWSMISPMQFKRSDAAATAYQSRVYIVGGFSGLEVLNSAECYDPTMDMWSSIAFMTSPRSGVSCVTYRDSIYVVGGFDGTFRLRSGEKYSFKRNTWSPIPEMHKTRSNFAIEIIDDEIYVVGGFDGNSTIADVECYNNSCRLWRKKTDINMHKSALAACVVRKIPNPRDFVHKNRDRVLEERRRQSLGWTFSTRTPTLSWPPLRNIPDAPTTPPPPPPQPNPQVVLIPLPLNNDNNWDMNENADEEMEDAAV